MECIICANIFNHSKSSDAIFLGCHYDVCKNCSIKSLQKCNCGIIYEEVHNCSRRTFMTQYDLLRDSCLSEEVVYDNYVNCIKDDNLIFGNVYDSIIDNNIDNATQILYARLKMFQIFAKTMTGKTIILNIPIKTNTIDPIKILIYQQEGLPINQQRIIHTGRQCEDGREYEFEKEMTLHLALRLSGD